MTVSSPVTAVEKSTPTPDVGPARVLARVSVGAAATAVAAIAVAGFLDPGYSPRSEAISALASQESASAPIMVAGFLAMAVTLLAAGAALFRVLPDRRSAAGAVLVVLGGVLTVVVGFARQDCSTLQAECLARESAGTVSASHWVHNLVSLALFLLLTVAAFLWTAGVRRSSGRTLARVSLAVAVLTAACAVWFGSGAYGTSGGLVEQALVLLAFGWPAFLAARLTRSSGTAPATMP